MENSPYSKSSVSELVPMPQVSIPPLPLLKLLLAIELTSVVMQVGDDYYEDLTPESTVKILDALANGERPKPGPQSSRQTSENAGGLTA